jgi:hypothetical protein
MLDAQDFIRRLSDFAVGRLTIREFEEWFVAASWNVHDWAEPVLRDAVYMLEIAFAEHSNGHVSTSFLRASAGDIVRELETSANFIVPLAIGNTMSASEVLRAQVPATSVLAA